MAQVKTKKEDTVEKAVEAPMGEKVVVKETPQPKKMKNLGKQDTTIKVDLKEPKKKRLKNLKTLNQKKKLLKRLKKKLPLKKKQR